MRRWHDPEGSHYVDGAKRGFVCRLHNRFVVRGFSLVRRGHDPEGSHYVDGAKPGICL